MNMKTTLTISQAAEKLDVPATTLRRWTNRGIVPFLLTPGGQRRFTREQIRQITSNVLSTSQAAREVGVSPSTLRRWARRDLIPFTRTPSGRLRFTWDDIREIKSQMVNEPENEFFYEAA